MKGYCRDLGFFLNKMNLPISSPQWQGHSWDTSSLVAYFNYMAINLIDGGIVENMNQVVNRWIKTFRYAGVEYVDWIEESF